MTLKALQDVRIGWEKAVTCCSSYTKGMSLAALLTRGLHLLTWQPKLMCVQLVTPHLALYH